MKTLSCLCLLALCSCVSYSHSYTKDGLEQTRFGSFLMMGGASKIHSATKMGTNYSRTVGVGELSGKGDAELIQAIVTGIVEGLKKSQLP